MRFPSTLLVLALITLIPSASCARADESALDHAITESLLRLPTGALERHPQLRPSVLRFLERNSGSPKYIQVAKQLGVNDQTDVLIDMVAQIPFSTINVDALEILASSPNFNAVGKFLSSVTTSDEQKVAIITALGYLPGEAGIAILKDQLQLTKPGPQVRIAIVSALGRSLPGQRELLAHYQRTDVPPDIRFALSNALYGSKNEAILAAAKKLLPPTSTGNQAPLAPIAELVRLRGDAAVGQKIFETKGTCAKCHQVRGAGKSVGPDLSEIGSKLSREDLYVAILNPSAAVSHNFETYALLDLDGNITTGLLINQQAESTTLRNAEGVDRTVAAKDIAELKKLTTSLMPADLQLAMNEQELVDLVDYLVLLKKEGEGPFQALSPLDNSLVESHASNSAVPGLNVSPDLKVQLFASEPMMLSPTSIDVDSLGRVWVCEAVNYRHFRNPYNAERTAGDRILVLEDTDHDGHADRSTVFYQGSDIDSPHGVTVLGNTVLVSAGENVWVFSDSDGDLKPESHKPLFTGISGVQHDHGIHAFEVGPDGKLYFNFGNEGKQLKNARGETIVDKAGNVVDNSRHPYQEGMVFRCDADGSNLETLGWNFRNNWEVCVDSFGSLWQSDNDDDGNRGTRINFVMEYGNYGYKDELTGASWQQSRIGLESEKPLQHWHLNDPGVVPNLIQTGAGSPTGIFFYEGELLPERFRNQIIHTDPGPAVVRAYPVHDQGAGYTAEIDNLIAGSSDPWFRPVDVCAAPDGSLFVADWYDPGVGGHRMGDAQHGRIFRILPSKHSGAYHVDSLPLTTAEDALRAIRSPNLATRYVGQTMLQSMDPIQGIRTIQFQLRTEANSRYIARLLWQWSLLSTSPEVLIPQLRLSAAVNQALSSTDSNIRIVGLRMARRGPADLITSTIDHLLHDPSPQVRREVAIALREQPGTVETAKRWTELALQHDGQDRWYLEALGIGADLNWALCYDTWLAAVKGNWDTPAGRDIVWRARDPRACQMLVELIATSQTEAEQHRYFRALDFQPADYREQVLSKWLTSQR
ncbi:MAG: c-type cytochrome [Planctomycetales bacterium]|nr:c-type cytochrome [Planctomycetales bacterium]